MLRVRSQILLLCRILLHIEQLPLATVLNVHDGVNLLPRKAEVEQHPEEMDLVEERQGGALALEARDGGAIRVELPRPHAVDLVPSNQLVGVFEDCLITDIKRVRPAVRALEDVLPLGHAVHRREQGQPLLCEPIVGLGCRFILLVNSGEFCNEAIPIGDRDHASMCGAAPGGRDNTTRNQGVRADAAFPIRVLTTLQRVIVRGAWLVDGTTVV
mmetsp:Transcript_113043/g.330381  ORF Transcript_113043/g.330381 Transcript_113043/m.330381 type:complete len:214 (-) Transcript_113043:1179-1820(-)